jgi:hypothetical protein
LKGILLVNSLLLNNIFCYLSYYCGFFELIIKHSKNLAQFLESLKIQQEMGLAKFLKARNFTYEQDLVAEAIGKGDKKIEECVHIQLNNIYGKKLHKEQKYFQMFKEYQKDAIKLQNEKKELAKEKLANRYNVINNEDKKFRQIPTIPEFKDFQKLTKMSPGKRSGRLPTNTKSGCSFEELMKESISQQRARNPAEKNDIFLKNPLENPEFIQYLEKNNKIKDFKKYYIKLPHPEESLLNLKEINEVKILLSYAL